MEKRVVRFYSEGSHLEGERRLLGHNRQCHFPELIKLLGKTHYHSH